MTTRKLYLVAYDISEPKRLARALDVCREYATGGQKSVHECWLTQVEKREVLARLAEVIDLATDRVHLFRLDPRMEVRTMGIAVKPADGKFFFIG